MKRSGIDDRHGPFALAHMAACFERLAEGEPALCAEAALDTAIRGSAHSRCRRARWRRSSADQAALRHLPPRLDQGHAAVFEFADDLVADLLTEAIAVGKGVALRMPELRAASRRARQFAKVGFVGWAPAKNRFKIASGDSDDD
jgi:hypothetical protein